MLDVPSQSNEQEVSDIRSDWTRGEIQDLFKLPLNDLLYRAHTIHRAYWQPNQVQLSTLLSIKTGGCPEDCKYCAQSSHYDTGLEADKLLDIDAVRQAAEAAKSAGATRFCMGAAWRELKDRDVEKVVELVSEVRGLGLETCMTLGMITQDQAQTLKKAGLDYYNHNVDTSPEYYDEIITTRSYAERLETLQSVRDAGIKVCSGGIIGMGEKETDRAGMLETLATLDPHPESVPINMLVVIPGTPLDHVKPLDPLDWVRTIAVARILMPKSYVRLSAGRSEMSDETQAMCFFAGANSIFYGEKLLTTGNPDVLNDQVLFDKLGLEAEPARPPIN